MNNSDKVQFIKNNYEYKYESPRNINLLSLEKIKTGVNSY